MLSILKNIYEAEYVKGIKEIFRWKDSNYFKHQKQVVKIIHDVIQDHGNMLQKFFISFMIFKLQITSIIFKWKLKKLSFILKLRLIDWINCIEGTTCKLQ